MKNIFDMDGLAAYGPEIFETLIETPHLRLERIVTPSPYHEPGAWYDQDRDEWVLLLKGSAMVEYETGEIVTMNEGDHLLIPAHKVHRVRWSSPDKTCIWLALHAKLK